MTKAAAEIVRLREALDEAGYFQRDCPACKGTGREHPDRLPPDTETR